MTIIVVDCSALAAMLFEEPEATGVATLPGSASLLASRFIEFELANVGVKKIRRGESSVEEGGARLARLPARRISCAGVEPSGIVRLAPQDRLPAYDAGYPWLANSRGVGLVTFDREPAAESAA